jgi:hypothetical protein
MLEHPITITNTLETKEEKCLSKGVEVIQNNQVENLYLHNIIPQIKSSKKTQKQNEDRKKKL